MAVCPIGWHLASRDDWEQLITTAGGKSSAGTKLKSKSNWSSEGRCTGGGTDDFGFSALPGGEYHSGTGSFSYIGQNGTWWTDAGGQTYYYSQGMGCSGGYVSESSMNFEVDAYSVRCVLSY